LTEILVCGAGAVSPAGWRLANLRSAWETQTAPPITEMPQPNGRRVRVRQVPPVPAEIGALLRHPRLRRSSPISQYAVAASQEALGNNLDAARTGGRRLGVVFCVMAGCIQYTRRFYHEALNDPATASPLVFPETVFNAPASHLSSFLGPTRLNYTLVGDPGAFLQGVALAAQWLSNDDLDLCLVVSAEEADWLSGDAFTLFQRRAIMSEGAGAICLERATNGALAGRVRLNAVTDAHSYGSGLRVPEAAEGMRSQMPVARSGDLLCDGSQGLAFDRAEQQAWHDWKSERWSPKVLLGEGLAAGSAWQSVLAIDALQRGEYQRACVSVVGCHQQAIGAVFERIPA
jgi:hypothetical protein